MIRPIALISMLVLAVPAWAQTPLELGVPSGGTIAPSDPTADDGTGYDEFTLSARQGEALIVVLRSSEFDALLVLGRTADGKLEQLAFDDDGAGGTDARLMWTVPADGTYRIRVGTVNKGEQGSYTLIAERESSPDDLPDPAPIQPGETLTGELDHRDPQADDNIHFETYSFSAKAGEIYRVVMRSSAVDAQLMLARASGRSWIVAWGDDNSAGGTNALLIATIAADGDYVIVARSAQTDAIGAYSITLERLEGGR